MTGMLKLLNIYRNCLADHKNWLINDNHYGSCVPLRTCLRTAILLNYAINTTSFPIPVVFFQLDVNTVNQWIFLSFHYCGFFVISLDETLSMVHVLCNSSIINLYVLQACYFVTVTHVTWSAVAQWLVYPPSGPEIAGCTRVQSFKSSNDDCCFWQEILSTLVSTYWSQEMKWRANSTNYELLLRTNVK